MEKNIKLVSTGNVPIGTVVAFALSEKNIPDDWLCCDGTLIPERYRNLIELIGRNTPNLVGKTIIGCCTQQTPNPHYHLGETGGEQEHQLTIDEMPAHSHTINNGDFGFHGKSFKGEPDPDLPFETSPSHPLGGTDVAGHNKPHNNMPPFHAMNYIIYAGN